MLTSEEVAIALRTKLLFQIHTGLDDLDSRCGHFHHGITLKIHSGFIEQLGHPIHCELPECSSPLKTDIP